MDALSRVLAEQYPDANQNPEVLAGDYYVQDGQISYWNTGRLGPQPTEAEIGAAELRIKWAASWAERKRKEAMKTLSADPSTTTAAERAAALQLLTGAP